MQNLANKLGLKSARISKQTRHLAYDHPNMKAVREWVSMAIETKKIDPRLMCHFDQVWSMHYEPAKRVLFKQQDHAGQMKDLRKASEKAMLHKIRESLSLPADPNSVVEKKDDGPAKATLNAQSTLVPVDGARVARTVTTLSWSDGSMGRGYITAPATAITDSVAEKMNQELKGLVYIARGHESKSHMWTGDTLQQYLVFLKDEIKRKRQSLGVSFESKALVLCDAATVHSTGMYDKIRSRFELEANCILIHGGRSSLTDHGVQIVGGWGACGAPNDAWHQFWHYMRRAWMRLATGMSSSLKLRNAYENFGISIDGNSRFTLLGSIDKLGIPYYCIVLRDCTVLYRAVLYSFPYKASKGKCR